jgi:hypothetical protein
MPAFRFDGTGTFEENWSALMAELQSLDADMAAILAANKERLAAIVRQGQRNTNARASFNAEVVTALDALLAASSRGEGTP